MAYENNQSDFPLPAGGNEGSRKSENLLPKYFRTDANSKFLQATLDQLVQPGVAEKLNGYYGRQISKAYNADDNYVGDISTQRENYQFEPVTLIKDELDNVTFYKDYNDYLNQIKSFGGNTENQEVLNSQEYYAWQPHVDWDKFSNFREYYWLPYGPQTVRIAGQERGVESTVEVSLFNNVDNVAYKFSSDELVNNPTLILYKGQTYTFDIDAIGTPITFKTKRTLESSFNYNDGVSAQGVEKGTVTFQVDVNAPEVLYYVAENDINNSGLIQIKDIDENTDIDVEKEILGKKKYKSSNGIQLSTGMKVSFAGFVTPEKYATGDWYVEGVGSNIKLVPENELSIPGSYSDNRDVAFDTNAFDRLPFANANGYPATKDYIIVNRSSNDRNMWSRYNRWFHKNVIEESARINGQEVDIDQNARATRPIIEFNANLKLFNFGTATKNNVNVIDTFTKDIFSTVEGAVGYNIDGIDLVEGMRVLFTAEEDIRESGKIFKVKFITQKGRRQISLIEEPDTAPLENETVLALDGLEYKGRMFYYDGNTWNLTQEKTKVNQPPLFDLFDSSGISYGDSSTYPNSTFAGNKVFSYREGTGTNDSQLGFPITYRSIENIGDIVFDFNLLNSSFTYTDATFETVTASTDVCTLQQYKTRTDYSSVNGWIKANTQSTQRVLRQYVATNNQTSFVVDVFDNSSSLSDLDVKVTVNNNLKFETIDYVFDKTETNVIVRFNTALTKDDVVVFRCRSSATKNANGIYELPINLERNPLNNDITTFTLGEVNDHVTSIVQEVNEFFGVHPGPGNLRDIGNLSTFGRKFVQHSGPTNLALYHITDKSANIIKSIDFNRREYAKFKRLFIQTSLGLGFDGTPKAHVDLIFAELNKNKTSNLPFYFSDMVPTGGARTITYDAIPGNVYYALNAIYDITEPSVKAVTVYIDDEQLVFGQDYTFNTDGFCEITKELTAGQVITINEYETTDGSYVPPTPTKLGLYPKFAPVKFIDNSYTEPTEVIQGHDGSITKAYGDFRDDLILEFEKRIYNNIRTNYNSDIIDIHDFIPGTYRNTSVTKENIDNVMLKDFASWLTNIDDVDYTAFDFYNRSNSFSYNYSSMQSPLDTALPGYWRGVYKQAYDTDRPHTHPWEMLGLTSKPDWWETVYGPAPYTSNNLLLWEDLEKGIIAKPGVNKVVLEKYKRPGLTTHIPVNDLGQLLSPLDSGYAKNYVNGLTRASFVFGDEAPVETAWRRSSEYAYSLFKAWMLNQPTKIIGLGFDRLRTVRDNSNQIVYSTTSKRMRLVDLVYPNNSTTGSDSVRVFTSGFVNFIANYLASNVVSNYETYQSNVASITNQVAFKVGGFTDKSKFNLLLDSRTPLNQGNVFVPEENYQVTLQTSSPIDVVTYSGVVIEKASAGYIIRGYDSSNPSFKYYKYVPNQNDPLVNVGGVSDSFIEWDSDKRYVADGVVKYQETFYRVTTAHTSDTIFDQSKFAKLPDLPVVGGRSAQFRTRFDSRFVKQLPYGTLLRTTQEVVDFLLGYGDYLQKAGFVFDNFNPTLEAVENWKLSAKEFMFWTLQNWDAGSLITVSPSAQRIEFSTSYAVVDDIFDPFYEYGLVSANGTKLRKEFVNILRTNENTFSLTVKNTADGIYALKLPLVQKEHVVVLDNETVFKDIIYDLEAGYRQERIRVLGYRTADWAGGLNIPGFIYDDAIVTTWQQWKDYAIGDAVKYKEFYYAAITKVTGSELFVDSQWYRLEEKPQSKLLTNLEYKTNQFADFYDLDTDNFDVNQQEIAQHLIGYQKREYLANIINDDVSQYKFYQGMIADKGTKNVLTKLFDALSSADKESLEFYEEWAVRSGQYGASDGFEELEFLLDEEQFQLSPQPILLTETIPDDVSDLIYRQLPGSVFVAPNGYAHKPFPVKYVNDPELKTAGYVRQEDVNYTVKTFDDILNIDHTIIKQGQYVWVTFDKNDWNVYKYTDTPCTIQSAIPVENDAVLVLDRLTTIKVNDIVGLYDVTEEVQGFFKVKSVELNRITITLPEDVALTTEATGLTGILTTFVSNRVATLADANAFAETDVEFGETLWVDSITADGKGKWNVIKAGNSFDLDENLINPVENNISFGESIANDSANTVVAVGSPLDGDGKVYIYERQQDGSTTFGTLQPKQVIEPIANYSTTPGKFGQAMSMSPDGEYLVVTAPNSSNVKTAYKDEFTFATDYKLGSIVQYNGNLYKSRRTVKGRTDNVVFGTFDSASRWRSELYKLHGAYDDIPLIALGDLPLIDVEIDHILVRAPLDAYEGSNIGDTLYLDWNELSLNYTPDVKPEIVNIELTNPVRLTTNSNHSLADGDQVILTDVPNDNLSFRPIAFPYLYDNSDINTPFDTVQQSSVKGIEGTKYYAKVLTNQQIELYSDEALTIKVNGSVGFIGTANIGGFNGYLNKINKPFDNTFSGINKDFLSLNPHIIRRKVQEVFYILDPVNVPSVSAGDRVTTATGNADVVRVRNELGRLVIYADRKNGVFDESGTLYINDQFLVGSYTRPLADNVDRSTILGGYWEIPLASGFIPKDQQLTNTPTTDSGEGLVIVDVKNNYNPATLPGVGWTESTARLPYKSSIQNTLENPVEVLSSTSKAFKKETDLIRVLSHKSQGVAGNVTEVDVLDPRFVVRLPKNVSDKAVSATADGTTPNPYVGVYLNDIPANGVLPDISDTGFGADPYAIINVDKRVPTDLWNGYIDYDVFAEVDLAPGDIIREGQSGATAVIAFIQRDLDKSRLYVKDVAGEFSFGSRYIDGLAPQSMWLYKQIGANLTRIGTTESRQLADEDIGYLAVFTHTTNLSIPPKLTFALNSITDEVADYETKFITGIEYQTWIEEFKPGLPRVTLEPSTENNDWAQVDNIPINVGRDASSYTKEGAYFVYQNNSTTGQYDLVSGYILPNRSNSRELGHSVKLIKDNNFYKLVINSKEAHTNDGTDGNGRLYFVLNGTSEFGTYNWSLGRDPDFKGEYNTISSYYQDQVVIYNDVFYRALTNLSNEEFTPIKWQVIGSDIDFVGYLPNTSGLVIPGEDSSIVNLSTSGYGEVFDISDNGRVLATVARYDSGNKLVIYTLKDMHFQYVTEFTAPIDSDGYGNSITVSDNGNLIVVSAPGTDARESQQGKVFVYKNVAGTYSLQQELNSPNAELVEGFGQTLGFDGNQLIVTGATSDILLDTTFDRYENRDTTRNDYVNDPTKGFNVAETTYDNGFTTFVKRVSDSGNVYVYENINDTLVFGQRLKYSNFNVKNFGKNAIVNNNTILVGLPALGVTGNIQGQVAVYIKDDIDSTWSVYREPIDPADLNKFRGSFVYDTKQNNMLTRLDILDPILGKIPGTAEQELSYKTYYDPANYNVGFTNNKEQYIAWDDRNKGKLWWDLSTVKYIDYHQGSITYSQNTFNKLAEGASIDVYEWVESNILPSAWDNLADTNRGTALGISGTSKYGDTKYATQEIYDSVGQVFTTKYYFWVKATKVLPQIEGRNLTAYDIQNIITDPAGQKLKFVTILGNDRFVLYNCNNLVSDTDVAINFRYWTIENQDNNIHTEYQIVTDGFETSKPKSSIEQKWFDSLIGTDKYGRAVPDPTLSIKQKYGNLNRPRQGWFVNRKEALKQFIERVNRVLIKELAVDNLDLTKLSNKDPRPTILSGMFDSIIDTEAELRFVGTVRAEQAVLEPVCVDGTVTKIKVITRGRGYKNLPKITINGTGTDLELTPVLNNIGAITSVTVVNGGTNYTDDLTLTVRPLSTLVRSDSTLGGKWSIYVWDSTNRNWTISNQQSYDVAEYWNYKDWYAEGYSELTSVDYLIDNLYELNIIQDTIGDIVKVSSVGTGGWILLEKIVNVDTPDYSSGYKTVGREDGTLEFLSKLYTQDGGSLELRKILETIRDDLFVDELANEYNQLFFAGLRYVFTEQNYVDWAFKTSFIKAKHNVGELKEKTTYQNDNLPSFEKYIEEVKPYRTKVREYLSAYDKTDNTQSVVTDFELSPFYDTERGEIVSPQVKINDGVLSGINFNIDQYPQKHWVDNFTYSVEEVKIENGGSGYTNIPQVTITGGGGSGATASAYIGSGSVKNIVITNSGSGFTSIPTITIDGVQDEGGIPPKVSIVLGNKKVRSLNITQKFDRLSPNLEILNLPETELFTSTGTELTLTLKFPMDLTRTNVRVFFNDTEALSSQYSFNNKELFSTNKTHIRNQGYITLTNAQLVGTIIRVEYNKDISMLTAADRINLFYNATDGQLGKDLGQLMDGVDYGGVEVKSFEFGQDLGWDSKEWYTTSWDSYDENFDDESFVTTGPTFRFQLSKPLQEDAIYNVYVNATRVDDINYDGSTKTYIAGDGSTVLSLGNPNAIMLSITSDSTEYVVENGNYYIDIQNVEEWEEFFATSNPTITFRKSTSDGSFLPEGIGFDSLIEGGNLQYGTATGLDAGDINLDGDGFVTPTTSKGPEELVPGQLHDTLDLKVYDRSADGGSLISTRNYTATDGQVNFDLDVLPHNIFSAIVKVNGKILQSEDVPGSDSSVVGTPEYSINFTDKKLVLRDALVAGDKVNVLSMAGSGERILDTDHFIGDGTTRTFVTSVIWSDGIQSYINVDGANAQVSLFKTDSSYGDKAGLVGLDFVIPPNDNAFVYYSLFDTNEETIQRYSEVIIDRFIGDGSTVQFELSPEPASRLPLSHNIIVKVDDKILFPGYTQQWYITTAREYVLDRSQYPTSSLSPDAVDVYINGVKKVLLKDYRWNFNNSSVTLFDNVGETGDDLEIVITDSAEYEFSKNTLIGLPTVTGTFEPGETVEIGTGDSTVYTATVKSFTTGTGNLVVVGTVPGLSQAVDLDGSIPIVGLTSNATASSIVSITLVEAGDRLVLDSIPADGKQIDVYKFNRHELQDIQMETKTNVSRSVLTVGTDDYYEFNRLTKGLVKLRAPAVDTAYLWISLNGILLTPNVDYKLVKMDNYVQIDRPVKPNDKIQVIHFAADKASEKFGYRMFKDMLNRTHYKRLNQANVYFLAEPLSISDQAIQLTDAQGITQPSKELNVPGVIFVNGERIEYFEVVGKELRQLRRGTLGTGPADTYPAGTEIMDQSNSETIPYTDEMVSSIALDDESTQILLDWIPTKGVNEFEVFVAGRRLRKNSISMYQNQVVDANGIVTTELIAKDSPEGDITLAPEFTLNITDSSATVTLADAPVTGTRVVIVRKIGKTWQTPGEQLRYANNSIAEFIREATTDLPK
jgi:hypothetical protein